MKRRIYFYGSMLLLAAGISFWRANLRPPGELQHDGRTLSAWLNEVGEGPEEQRTRAMSALLAMEPEIWDRLVNMIATEDSFLRRAITRVGGERVLRKMRGRSAREQHESAIIAFAALRTYARPAAPRLVSLLDRPSTRDGAFEALALIGDAAVPELTGALSKADPEVRCAAAKLLGNCQSAASPALPALRRLLSEPLPEVRAAAADAIRKIETLEH